MSSNLDERGRSRHSRLGPKALARCGLGLGLVGLAAGCAPRPSASECEALAAHVVELARAAHEGRAADIAEAVADEHAAQLRDRCIAEGTRREVECVLAAESLETVQDCAPTR